MTKKITLFIDGEEKVFHQPERIKGSEARVGLKLGKRLEGLEDGIPGAELLDDMLQYISEYGYDKQFTAQELEDGLDARDLFEELGMQINGILTRDDDPEGKLTSAKKA